MTYQCLTAHSDSVVEQKNHQQLNKLIHGKINPHSGGLTCDMRYNETISCFKRSVDITSSTQFNLLYTCRYIFNRRKSALFVSNMGTVKHNPICLQKLDTLRRNNYLCNATDGRMHCKTIFKKGKNTQNKFLHLKHDKISNIAKKYFLLYWYLLDYPIFIHVVITLIAIFYVYTLFYIFKKVDYKNVTLYLKLDQDTDKLLFLVRFILIKKYIGLHRKITSVTLSVTNLKPKLIEHLDPYVYEKTIFTNTFKIIHLTKEKVQSLFDKISSPMFGFKNRLDEYACYPVFEMSRVASFRNVDLSTLPHMVYATQLAASGFYYSGEELTVTCVSCGSRVELSRFTSSPASRVYHGENCSFAEDEKENVWIFSASSGGTLEPEQVTSLAPAGLSETQVNVLDLEKQLPCTNSELSMANKTEIQDEYLFDEVSSLASSLEETGRIYQISLLHFIVY